MNLKIILYFALVIIISSSCKKDKESEIQDLTKDYEKNLVDKHYRLISSTSDPAYPIGNGIMSTDLYKDYYSTDCMKDDFILFKSNGIYIIDNGPIKCDSLEFQTTTLNWEFRENKSLIYIYKKGGTYYSTRKILINDGTTFKYEMVIKSDPNTSHIWTETWVKK